MELIPYLMFNGNCAEALEFYKDSLGGSIEGLSTFGEAPMPCEEADKNKVMHATFKFHNGMLMASDSMGSRAPVPGSNVHLSLNLHDNNDMEQKFNKLADGGQVTMPLQDTFWGARFGMLIDKFGIYWMFNCEQVNEGDVTPV